MLLISGMVTDLLKLEEHGFVTKYDREKWSGFECAGYELRNWATTFWRKRLIRREVDTGLLENRRPQILQFRTSGL